MNVLVQSLTYQKGLVTGIEDTIHEVEKMLSVTRSLKAV